MDSGSSSPPNPSSSLHGLTFGRKIYFEDAAKPAPGSTSSTPRRIRGGGGGGGSPSQGGGAQPPRCQVEGCNVDLSDVKTYYSRHKVCGMHSKSSQVIVGGIEQRFCQQCSRFHQLSEFDQGKRSCRRRLAGHNERRRKPPPASLFSPRFGRLPSTIFEKGTRSGGFIMDFTRDSWPPTRLTDHDPSDQANNTKFLMHHDHHHHQRNNHPWQGSSENPPPILQPSSGTAFSSPVECYTAGGGSVVTAAAATDSSSCALSLLSNQPQPQQQQPWGSRPDHDMNHPFHSWAFKGDEVSHDLVPPGQFLQPLNGHHFSGEVDDEVPQQGRRQQYMEELHHSRHFGSSNHHQMEYWPL